jgi:hypothetical protein
MAKVKVKGRKARVVEKVVSRAKVRAARKKVFRRDGKFAKRPEKLLKVWFYGSLEKLCAFAAAWRRAGYSAGQIQPCGSRYRMAAEVWEKQAKAARAVYRDFPGVVWHGEE